MRHLVAAALALATSPALAQQGTPVFETLGTSGNASIGGNLTVAGTITGAVSAGSNYRVPGCVGNGVADDAACLQAALNAGGTVNLGKYLYKINTPLVATAPVTIVGTRGSGGIYATTCTTGLLAGTPNMNLLTLAGANSRVTDTCFQMASALNGATAGAAITSPGGANSSIIDGNQINLPFIGIDVSGGLGAGQNAATLVQNNVITNPSTAGGVGFRIGKNSIGGATVDTRILNNSVACYSATTAIGTLFLDAGGAIYAGNETYGCGTGVKIFPGAGQHVEYLFAHDLLGDTSSVNDLFIDAPTATSVVRTLSFLGTWTSTVNVNGVTIQNTGGTTGAVKNIRFVAHRAIIQGANPASAFNIVDGDFISIRDSSICALINAPLSIGINVATSVPSHLSFTNNTISTCGGTIGFGVNVADGGFGFQLIGNDFAGAGTPLVYHPNGENTIISGNFGIDSGISIVAAASTVTLPPNPVIMLSGTTTINTIAGRWQDRTVKVTATDAAGLTLAAGGGGGACRTTVLAQYQTASLTWNALLACWIVG